MAEAPEHPLSRFARETREGKGSIMERYSQTDQRDHAADCHRDNLREHGFDRDRASRIAADAADMQRRTLDKQANTLARLPLTRAEKAAEAAERLAPEHQHTRRELPPHERVGSRFRRPFPWEAAKAD